MADVLVSLEVERFGARPEDLCRAAGPLQLDDEVVLAVTLQEGIDLMAPEATVATECQSCPITELFPALTTRTLLSLSSSGTCRLLISKWRGIQPPRAATPPILISMPFSLHRKWPEIRSSAQVVKV